MMVKISNLKNTGGQMGILQEQLVRTLNLLSNDHPEIKIQIERATRHTLPDEDPKTLLVVLSILQRTIHENPEILNKLTNEVEFKELERLTRLHSEHIILSDEPQHSPPKTGFAK